jgi:hypothetical protein
VAPATKLAVIQFNSGAPPVVAAVGMDDIYAAADRGIGYLDVMVRFLFGVNMDRRINSRDGTVLENNLIASSIAAPGVN